MLCPQCFFFFWKPENTIRNGAALINHARLPSPCPAATMLRKWGMAVMGNASAVLTACISAGKAGSHIRLPENEWWMFWSIKIITPAQNVCAAWQGNVIYEDHAIISHLGCCLVREVQRIFNLSVSLGHVCLEIRTSGEYFKGKIPKSLNVRQACGHCVQSWWLGRVPRVASLLRLLEVFPVQGFRLTWPVDRMRLRYTLAWEGKIFGRKNELKKHKHPMVGLVWKIFVSTIWLWLDWSWG